MTFWWIILAEHAPWERLEGRLHSQDAISWKSWLGLLVLAILIGGLIAVSRWLSSRDPMVGGQGSQFLFRELAMAHQLTWRDRWLLKRTARAAGLEHPVHVFLDPSVYEGEETARRLRHIWPRVLALRDKLFEGGEES